MADTMKDVVVLIPGIGGSVLQRDGKDVWAFGAGAALRGVLTLGRSIKRLQLDGDDPEADDLGDGITAPRLMSDLHVVPGLDWKIDGYGHIRERLMGQFDLRPGRNYFELAYDWRRDNRVAARALARQSKQWLEDWRRTGDPDAKLVLIGHSMGGIVARLFLEEHGGHADTRALITFGTPYSGSLNALRFLHAGFRKGWGPFTIDLSAMLRSFTSVYQLLPSYRCLRGEGGTWEHLDSVDWSGTGIDDARLRAAVQLHRDLRQAVDDRRAAGGPGYDIRPVVGDFQRSGWAAARDGDDVEILPFRTAEESGGDGTVPKVSAVPHELLQGLTNVTFVSQQHSSLQNDRPVLDHVIGLLRSVAIGTVPVFPAGDTAIALDVDDATTAEPLTVRAHSERPGVALTATVARVDGQGAPRVVPMVPRAEDTFEAELSGLAADRLPRHGRRRRRPGRHRRRQRRRPRGAGAGSRSVTGPFEVFDLSVLAADGHLWLSAHSEQGSVYGVPRPLPAWAQPAYATPAEWLGTAISHARDDAGAEARAIGEQLRALVFDVPEVATLFERTRGVATARAAQVLLRLLAAPQSLSAWPWELLLDPQHPDAFLATARDTHVVRAGRSRTYPVRREPIAPPLNLLLVLSSPLRAGMDETETPFDLYEEKRTLLAELRPLVERGLLRVVVEDRPTLDRLRSRMIGQRRGFHIVHYLGHAQPAGLKLEASTGRGRLVGSAEFGLLLQQLPDLRLAVFAGCETARAPRRAGARDVAGAAVDGRRVHPRRLPDGGRDAGRPAVRHRAPVHALLLPSPDGRPDGRRVRPARPAGDRRRRPRRWPAAQLGGPVPVRRWQRPRRARRSRARATAPEPERRVGLRLGVRQGELRFISRLSELRESIDVLTSRGDTRLLMVVGQPGTGKTAFLDRVVEELDVDTAYLLVSVDRLLEEDDPLQFLTQRVCEVVSRAGRRPPAQGRTTSGLWWERLLEVLADTPFALALDDADHLRGDDPRVVVLREALADLTRRRGRTRLALAANDELVALTSTMTPGLVRTIRLQALSWPEVWQWIRRNLPVLNRYDETALAAFYVDLPRLEDWEALADAVANLAAVGPDDLPALVRTFSTTLAAMTPATTPGPPPLFGAAPGSPSRPRQSGGATKPGPPVPPPAPPPPPDRGTLRVAVAGPHTEGRGEEFARGVTQFAAVHQVAGRVTGPADTTSRLAELVPIASPFGPQGTSSIADIFGWIHAARDAGADVVLLDLGTPANDPMWDDVLPAAAAEGRLVIAAGGNDGAPNYPAWHPAALAVGALEADGTPTHYSFFDAEHGKPELYAPKTVSGTPLAALVVDQPGLEGTSFAAMHVLAAAVLVWATDRGLSADEVRSILVDTASRRDDAEPQRRLDTEAALRHTRRQLLLDTLEWGPLGLHELLAATGMRPELALPILDAAVAGGVLRRVIEQGGERYERPDAVYAAYARTRQDASSPERTRELIALMPRIGTLARRGRFQADEIRAMWESGHPGRRVAALAAIQARPDLGSPSTVLAGITASRSSFEQYAALAAALAMAPRLTPDERGEVRDAIAAQQGSGGWIRPDGDRSELVGQLEVALGDA